MLMIPPVQLLKLEGEMAENPTSRTINDHDRTEAALDAGESLHAQPVRPDDFDSSHDFDRRRNPDKRPPLDRDPLLRM